MGCYHEPVEPAIRRATAATFVLPPSDEGDSLTIAIGSAGEPDREGGEPEPGRKKWTSLPEIMPLPRWPSNHLPSIDFDEALRGWRTEAPCSAIFSVVNRSGGEVISGHPQLKGSEIFPGLPAREAMRWR